MWLFTSKGMLSVVAHREIPNSLMIRARSSHHIAELFPNAEIIKTPDADYAFRVIVDRNSFALFMDNYIQNIGYDNFKNSISEQNYHSYCGRVWSIMYQYGSMFAHSRNLVQRGD
jgi:hypothetical protein